MLAWSPSLPSSTHAATGRGITEGIDATPETEPNVWINHAGSGFIKGTRVLNVSAGAVLGIAMLGGREEHDLALLSLAHGWILSAPRATNHWHRGQWEFRAELFGGGQFSPQAEWLIGLTPHLRYNFLTGSKWVPFLGGGAGVTFTSIEEPDLSGDFEFNLQATAGTHYFIRQNVALTLEARFLHISCAGLSEPNQGLNGMGGFIGLSWFF